ncbi:ATP-binding cassette domain-containing protein [Streptomyces sp. MUM 178J]|uniref:ATP-binding cassette domain-containing protein n=1 Tax=Streptomyces sp. MUM 178J TaxID=2791991 RepID=UPI001F04BC9A|nr:ATP-binding cassette domain-containing protein [Streptomyces sp. MUM 178J]WRQ82711.1 ATP-binding cassette domain-containing protein [Streptomyces sp. MUM 178J]
MTTRNSAAAAGSQPVAAVAGVTVRYGSTTALDDVSLEFRSGVTGLLGPNGAGKSTLLSVLSTARRPNSGAVALLGEETPGRASRARRVRERIGVLPQSFGFYPRFTVLEFTEYAAWLRRVPAARRRERAREALHLVQMEKHADARMGALSGGMLRRVGIAQAMVNEPALVLLDEPTVGLDPAQRVGFRTLITELGERCAVVMSTHLAEDVAHVCGRVAVLLEGSVRFTGTVAQLCALPRADYGDDGGSGDGAVDGSAVEAGYLHLAGAGAVTT